MTRSNRQDSLGKNKEIVGEFLRFTSLVHDGDIPYDWQVRLVSRVCDTGQWPDEIDAPTGSGKSRVIDVHVFAQAMAGLGKAEASTPRRLALIVDRRALVDSQYDQAMRLVRKLEESAAQGNEDALRWLRGLHERNGNFTSGLGEFGAVLVANMRGGQATKDPLIGEWKTFPNMVAVLCFTPEMFGSRLLFRGYGVGRRTRSMEAGLLAYDTVAVIDEAHLSQQLAETCSQVKRIEAYSRIDSRLRPLQTVKTTATPVSASQTLIVEGVTEDDLALNPELRRRLTTPKPVTLVEVGAGADRISDLVRTAKELRKQTGGTVGVVVNTVHAATEVSQLLKERETDGEVRTVVGPMRLADRVRDEEFLAESSGGSQPTKASYVVGTQTLEVGLDISFDAMVTELASGSALAQRAGRVNRFGQRDSAPITIAIQEEKERDDKNVVGPYTSEELADALTWLQKLPAQGLSAWAVAEIKPPKLEPQRLILQRIEYADIENLSVTRDATSAEARYGNVGPAGVDLWIRDSFDTQRDVMLAVRKGLPSSSQLAAQLLNLTPLFEEEMVRVSMGRMGQFVERLKNPPDDLVTDRDARTFIVPTDGTPREWTIGEPVEPGSYLVMDDSARCFTGKVFDPMGENSLPDKFDDVIVDRNRVRASAIDVKGQDELPALTYCMRIRVSARDDKGDREVTPGINVSVEKVMELARDVRMLQNMTDINAGDAQTGKPSRANVELGASPLGVFTQWLRDHELDHSHLLLQQLDVPGVQISSLAGFLDEMGASIDYVGTDDFDEEFVIVITSKDASKEKMSQQVATPGRQPVLLDHHQKAVAERAEMMAKVCGVEDFATVLSIAGILHDEGKRDPRFQDLLRVAERRSKISTADESWAKSRFRSWSREQKFSRAQGLSGWRHEQRSAAVAWVELAEGSQQDRALVTRLVGTTHGHGRTSFPHSSGTLMPDSVPVDAVLRETARELFDEGGWEALVEQTSLDYGFWGVAYLEALLRASDMQVSGEGR